MAQTLALHLPNMTVKIGTETYSVEYVYFGPCLFSTSPFHSHLVAPRFFPATYIEMSLSQIQTILLNSDLTKILLAWNHMVHLKSAATTLELCISSAADHLPNYKDKFKMLCAPAAAN